MTNKLGNGKRCFRWGSRLEKCPFLEIRDGQIVCTMGGADLKRIEYDAPDMESGRIVLVEAKTCPEPEVSLERWDGNHWVHTGGGDRT